MTLSKADVLYAIATGTDNQQDRWNSGQPFDIGLTWSRGAVNFYNGDAPLQGIYAV
jgi:hypothetical protein